MGCHFARPWVHENPTMSGVVRTAHCACELKELGGKERLKVYEALFQLGLDGSVLSDECPRRVWSDDNWTACPFREPAEADDA